MRTYSKLTFIYLFLVGMGPRCYFWSLKNFGLRKQKWIKSPNFEFLHKMLSFSPLCPCVHLWPIVTFGLGLWRILVSMVDCWFSFRHHQDRGQWVVMIEGSWFLCQTADSVFGLIKTTKWIRPTSSGGGPLMPGGHCQGW